MQDIPRSEPVSEKKNLRGIKDWLKIQSPAKFRWARQLGMNRAMVLQHSRYFPCENWSLLLEYQHTWLNSTPQAYNPWWPYHPPKTTSTSNLSYLTSPVQLNIIYNSYKEKKFQKFSVWFLYICLTWICLKFGIHLLQYIFNLQQQTNADKHIHSKFLPNSKIYRLQIIGNNHKSENYHKFCSLI